MARYLTPSKVGLLALVSLYTESIIPSVATIPILSFLASHALRVSTFSNVRSQVIGPKYNPSGGIEELQKATASHASGVPGRTVWDLLLQKLWRINSFDALHVFLDDLSLLLQKSLNEQQKAVDLDLGHNPNRILLSRISPLGSFIRRAQLEFTRLPFHDGVALWKAFVVYRNPTLQYYKKRNPAAGPTTFDSNLQEVDLAWGHRLTRVVYGDLGSVSLSSLATSTADIEKLLEYQVDHMQSKSSSQSRFLLLLLILLQGWVTVFLWT